MGKSISKFKRRWTIVRRRHIRRMRHLTRHPILVPIATFVVLIGLSAGGYAVLADTTPRRDARVVIVSDNGSERTVPSIEPTVGGLINKLGIKLAEGDIVEPAANTPINQDDFRINVYRAVPVQVVDGSNKTFAFSAATTPRAVARQTGAQLYAEDRVVTAPVNDFLKQGAIGEQVMIERAMPVSVNLYGTPEVIRTHAKTVGELLKEKGITLAGSDQVTPAADTPLSANLPVFIARNGTAVRSVTEAIAMPVETLTDANLAYGTNAVRQQGAPGQRVVTYQVELKNGIEVSRKTIQTVVTQEPVKQIVVQGASLSGIKGDMQRAGIAPGDFNYVDFIVQKESRWNPNARNASSGAYGLCKALPGSKMASAGSDWSTNPVTQLRWCDGYAKGRYGSWARAYSFWRANNYW